MLRFGSGTVQEIVYTVNEKHISYTETPALSFSSIPSFRRQAQTFRPLTSTRITYAATPLVYCLFLPARSARISPILSSSESSKDATTRHPYRAIVLRCSSHGKPSAT